MLGRYVTGADTRYLTLFLDFLNTLDDLQEGTRMNQEFVQFLAERRDDAGDFFAEVMRFKDDLRKKVRELGSLIDVEQYQNVRQYFYRERTGLYDDLGHDIRISEDLLTAIDTVVDAQGWRIYIWPRQGNRSELASLLARLKIPMEEGDLLIPSTRDIRFVYPIRFPYSENLDRIRPVLQDLVDKIATGRAGVGEGQAGRATTPTTTEA